MHSLFTRRSSIPLITFLGTVWLITACGSDDAALSTLAINVESGEQRYFAKGDIPQGWVICAAKQAEDPCAFVRPPEPPQTEPCAAITDAEACIAPQCLLLKACLEIAVAARDDGEHARRCFDVCVPVPPVDTQPCRSINEPKRCSERDDCEWRWLASTVVTDPHRWPWPGEGIYKGVCVPKDDIIQPPKCRDHADCQRGQVCNIRSCDDGATGTCVLRPEMCPQIYMPVCGCNGVTYGTDCERLAKGAKLAHEGKCKPVVATCRSHADCAKNEVCDLHSCGGGAVGTCVARPDGCYDLWLPVCGCDGVTYGYDCERLVAGVGRRETGTCAAGTYCQSMRYRYERALADAQSCVPDTDAPQCTMTRPARPPCTCPVTWVNEANQEAIAIVDAILVKLAEAGCFRDVPCTALACPMPPDRQGTCEKDADGGGRCMPPSWIM